MRSAILVAAVALLAGCGSGNGGTATPVPLSQSSDNGGSTPTPNGAGGTIRTVLSPLGINLHSSASLTASRVGSASQGATLTVLTQQSSNGGWYQVQTSAGSGWIVADGTLTAPGYFQSYSSTSRGFAALYPQSWTFAEEANDALFRPQQGNQNIVVTSAGSLAGLGQQQLNGYAAKNQTSEVVGGVTWNLITYSYGGSSSPTPDVGTAVLLTSRQVITLGLDGSHFLRIAYNYSGSPDTAFADFYNSMTFPFPQCEQTATPSPT